MTVTHAHACRCSRCKLRACGLPFTPGLPTTGEIVCHDGSVTDADIEAAIHRILLATRQQT